MGGRAVRDSGAQRGRPDRFTGENEVNPLGRDIRSGVKQARQLDWQSRLWAGGAREFWAFFAVGWFYAFRDASTNRLRWMFTLSLRVLFKVQAAGNSGESMRSPTAYLSPLIMIFGAGFFFVPVGSHPILSSWPRASARRRYSTMRWSRAACIFTIRPHSRFLCDQHRAVHRQLFLTSKTLGRPFFLTSLSTGMTRSRSGSKSAWIRRMGPGRRRIVGRTAAG